MEGMKNFKGKRIKVIYEDIRGGKSSAGLKIGILEDSDQDFIYLKTENKMIAIPKSIIRRIEMGVAE